jgi:rhodanese-related sulfurtransferase
MKRFALLAAAATLIFGAGTLSAQCPMNGKQCSEKEKGACCAKAKGASLSSLKSVSKNDLVKMMQARNVTVVDARGADAFAEGHIDGAINYGKAELPSDKSAKLVFYCGGLKCPMAEKAAKKAVESGYKNVMVYRGGWAEWSKSSANS